MCVKKNLKKKLFALVFYQNYLITLMRLWITIWHKIFILNRLLDPAKYRNMLDYTIFLSFTKLCWIQVFGYLKNTFYLTTVQLLKVHLLSWVSRWLNLKKLNAPNSTSCATFGGWQAYIYYQDKYYFYGHNAINNGPVNT